MNYLAHIFLSGDDPEVMLGNFIADGIKEKDLKNLPLSVVTGIRLHRRIDTLTDTHPSFKEASKILSGKHGKYAPVVLDILNDHLLCLNWESYSSEEFSTFEHTVYDRFRPLIEYLPVPYRRQVESLIEHEYLKAYRTRLGMSGVLARMDARTRFPSDFSNALDHLYDDLNFYSTHFNLLFSDLVLYVEK